MTGDGDRDDGPKAPSGGPSMAGMTPASSAASTPPAAQPSGARDLPDLVSTSDDDERPSITGTDGTVARFDMSYEPPGHGERVRFGPTLRQLAPSLVWLAFALVVVGLVVVGHASPSTSRLYVWVVEGDRGRPLGAVPLAALIALSGLGTLARGLLLGVVVTDDGIETRELVLFGMPRIRKHAWAQIDRVVVGRREVMVELWNGSYEKLPAVRKGAELAALVGGLALAKNRQVTRLAELPAERR